MSWLMKRIMGWTFLLIGLYVFRFGFWDRYAGSWEWVRIGFGKEPLLLALFLMSNGINTLRWSYPAGDVMKDTTDH